MSAAPSDDPAKADTAVARPSWSPWRAVVGFGVISLAADMVYEGARSVYGPLLGALGASAFVVGAISGAGEAAALLLRLVSGRLADRTGRYWALTILGYALTAVCVPLLAITPALGAAGLVVAATLILAERTGKAIRSPAKSALLADAAGQVGMGRGLGVHKALDQIGAFAGPLVVAALVTAAATDLGGLQLAFSALAVPAVVVMVLLVVTRRRMPSPATEAPAAPDDGPPATPVRRPLPTVFWRLAAGAALCTSGLVTFGLVSFHLVERRIVPVAGVPLLYAAAMLAGAVAALVTGQAYDRFGGRVLVTLPFLVAGVAPLAFRDALAAVVVGVVVWGAALGVQDSTVKALVADLVPRDRRATAYGLFAAVQGAGALAGGLLTGALYEWSVTALVIGVAVVQLIALPLLLGATSSSARRTRGRPDRPAPPS